MPCCMPAFGQAHRGALGSEAQSIIPGLAVQSYLPQATWCACGEHGTSVAGTRRIGAVTRYVRLGVLRPRPKHTGQKQCI
eukprot:1136993-Pelagomonas_calceolata.AAC.11